VAKKSIVKVRPDTYEKKLELNDNVEFDDLFKVAINHKQPKKKAAPRRSGRKAKKSHH